MVPMVSGVSTEVRQSAMDAFVTLASHLRPGDCGDQVSFAPCFVAGKWDKSMAIIWGLWGNDINLIDKYWWLICFLMYKILRRYYNIIRLSFFWLKLGTQNFSARCAGLEQETLAQLFQSISLLSLAVGFRHFLVINIGCWFFVFCW